MRAKPPQSASSSLRETKQACTKKLSKDERYPPTDTKTKTKGVRSGNSKTVEKDDVEKVSSQSPILYSQKHCI